MLFLENLNDQSVAHFKFATHIIETSLRLRGYGNLQIKIKQDKECKWAINCHQWCQSDGSDRTKI